MQTTLHPQYREHLDKLIEAIQNSQVLADYLEEEGDDEYKALVETFEPHIHKLHESVTYHNPLQLLSLEKAILDDGFEGLYIPKLLGYSVLRGYVGEDVKFTKPQDHFEDIILFACHSANFEQIQKRIGQAIQIGFALSSDIWISSLIDKVENKKVKSFLQSQKQYKYRDDKQRLSALVKYRKQFQSLRFMTASFPDTKHELHANFEVLRHFLKLRYVQQFDNASLLPTLTSFISNEEFHQSREFVELLIRIGYYYELDDSGKAKFTEVLDKLRNEYPQFEKTYFELLREHWKDVKVINLDCEKRLTAMVSRGIDDKLTAYYNVLDVVHSKGYIHDDAIETVQEFYFNNEGKSLENSNIRYSIYSQIHNLLTNLDVESYHDYFEFQKVITSYVEIFGNQQFNQNVKDSSLIYIKKLLKRYTDKRGRDYQDIKKFVKSTFLDLGFMNEKQLTDMFKTKRVKKPAATK